MYEATDTRSGFIPTIGIAAAIGVAADTVVTAVITAAAAADVAAAATVIGTFIGTGATRSFFSAFGATISITAGLISTRLTLSTFFPITPIRATLNAQARRVPFGVFESPT